MRKTAALILSCMLLLTACGQGGEAWQEQYDLGVRYLSEGNYQEAIVAFTAAIEIDPKRPEAYIGRGDAYMALGTAEALSNAVADYEEAVRLNGEAEGENPQWKLLELYVRQGDLERAAALVEEARQEDDLTARQQVQDLWSDLVEKGEISAAVALYQLDCCEAYVVELLEEGLAVLLPYSLIEETTVGGMPFLTMEIHNLGSYDASFSRAEQRESSTDGPPYWRRVRYQDQVYVFMTQDTDQAYVDSINLEYFPDYEQFPSPFWLSTWGLAGGESYEEVLVKMGVPTAWIGFFLETDRLYLHVNGDRCFLELSFDYYDEEEREISLLWVWEEEYAALDLGFDRERGFLGDVWLRHFPAEN